jgi:hypothetical protein
LVWGRTSYTAIEKEEKENLQKLIWQAMEGS